MAAGTIQIVGKNSSGLAKDIALLQREFGLADIPCIHTERRDLNPIQRVARKLGLHRHKRCRFRMNLFVEQPESWWLAEARVNVVIPNQEWFTPYAVALLPQIDEVWCKTHHAEAIFSGLGCHTRYLGFSGSDRWVEQYSREKRYDRFLHVGGGSIWKGTQLLIDTWCRHPEWPHLTVASRTAYLPKRAPNNITLLNGYIPEQEIIALQNRIGFYIQPTEMEGYGHTLVEALSARSIVIATDAAPMNEIISDGRGIPISAGNHVEPHFLGLRHFVMPEAIESAVEHALSLPIGELHAMADGGRTWFEQSDAAFRSRLHEFVAAHVYGSAE